MTPPSLPLRMLLLCLAFALAPPSARAQTPSDPNDPLGAESPCFDTTKIAESLALPEPLPFATQKDCPKLCKKAALACAKHAKQAGACETRWADDRARFGTRLECPGLRGAALKTCAVHLEATRMTRREAAKANQDLEVTACMARGTSCQEKCVVAP